MARLRLRLFGGLSVEDSGRLLGPAAGQPKRLALLALISRAGPQGMTRDRILALLWPESDEARARNSLNQAVHALKRDLGSSALVEGSFALRLNRDEIASDVADFEDALARGDLEGAARLHSAPFLDGFHLREAPGFERWVDEQREELGKKAVAAVRALTDDALGQQQLERAAVWARHALTLAPHDETALRRLLVILRDAGDRAGAARAYKEFSERLQSDLDVMPAGETQALIDQLRLDAPGLTSGPAARSPAATQPPEVVAPPPAASDAAPRRSVAKRLVGGAALGTLLVIVWNAAGSRFFNRPDTTAARLSGNGAAPEVQAPAETAASDTVKSPVALSVSGQRPGNVAVRQAATPRPPASIRPTLGRVAVMPLGHALRDTATTRVATEAAEAIAQRLSHSGVTDIVGPSTLRAAQATRTTEFEIGRRAQASVLIGGSVAVAGDTTLVIVHVHDPFRRRVVSTVRRSLAHPQAGVVLDSLSEVVAAQVLFLIDPMIGSWAESSTLPNSVEAFRSFKRGLEEWRTTGPADVERVKSTASFIAAWAADSSWPLPLAFAALSVADRGMTQRVDSLQGVVLPWRRPAVDAAAMNLASAIVHGRAPDQLAEARKLMSLAPFPVWHSVLANAALDLNRGREALDALIHMPEDDRRRLDQRGFFPMFTGSLSRAYHTLERYREQLDVVRAWRSRAGAVENTLFVPEIAALAGLGWVEEARRLADSAFQQREPRPVGSGPANMFEVLLQAGHELRAHGHDDAATYVHDLAGKDAIRAGVPAIVVEGSAAYFAGRWSDAFATYDSILTHYLTPPYPPGSRISPRNRFLYLARKGVAAARLGHREVAGAISDTIDAMGRAAQGRTSEYLVWRARIAAGLGDRDAAIHLLRVSLESGFSASALHMDFELAPLRGYQPFDALARHR